VSSTDDASTSDPPADGSPGDDPSDGDRFPYELAGVVVLALLVLLYGVLLGQAVLPAIGVAIPLVALYLFWRFVRAHERIADAME
jgi:hypothetical protein